MSTLEWIQWLLERGWTVECCTQHAKGFHVGESDRSWEWRDPTGISGDDYCSTAFDQLPPAVEEYVKSNAFLKESVI